MHLIYWCSSGNLKEKIRDHLPNFLIIENLTTQLELKLKPMKICSTHFKKNNLLRDRYSWA